jgi:hypothetical protein
VNKIVNPIWTPKDINVHANSKIYAITEKKYKFTNHIVFLVTYATNEEIREALMTTNQDFDQPRKMMLDVYTNKKSTASKSGLQPVLVKKK